VELEERSSNVSLSRRHFVRSLGFSLAFPEALRATSLPSADPTSSTTVFDATKYGVVPDGYSDNTIALMELRRDALEIKGPVTINLPPGDIGYKDNRWLFNINNFRLIGDPVKRTKLRSLYEGRQGNQLTYPLWYAIPFATNSLYFRGQFGMTSGHLFSTVRAGSDTVTLVNVEDAKHYAVGNRVLLYGFLQTLDGFPPGARFYDYKTIASVDAGKVSFTQPLAHSYNSQWFDVPDAALGPGLNCGKPRMLNLDRGSEYTYPSYASLQNLSFERDPKLGNQESAFMACVADILEVDNCSCVDHVWPSINREATYRRCNFGNTDLDKLCGTVRFLEGCTFSGNGIVSAVGIENLIIDDFKVLSGFVAVAPRHLTLTRGSIHATTALEGSIRQQPGENPVFGYIIERLTLDSTGSKVPHLQYLDEVKTMIADEMRGTSILLRWPGNWSNDDPTNLHIRRIAPGTILRNRGTQNAGVVTDITFDGEHYVIAGTWRTPAADKTWEYRTIQQFRNLGGHRILDNNDFSTWDAAVTAGFDDLS
jgi:hypothetical protein